MTKDIRSQLNGDDNVNISDFSILQSHYGQCETPGNPLDLPEGDINGDNCVNSLDFSILSSEYGQTCGT